MKTLARVALVVGTLVSLWASWRLIRAFAFEMDRKDVSFFAMLYWAGLFSSALSVWGMLTLRRLRVRSELLLPFEVFGTLAFLGHLGYFAYVRIPFVRTTSTAVYRVGLTWGMSREVPFPARNVSPEKP